MPKEGFTLKFKNFSKQMRVPFVVEADFESLTKNLDTSQPNSDQSYTKKEQKHTPSGFHYYIKSLNDKVYFQDPMHCTKQSEDEDIAQTFVEMLEKDITWIYNNCGNAKIIISKKQEKAFNKATICWICQEKLVKDKNDKDYKNLEPVRDHFYYTGEYWGPAQNSSNLKYIKPKFTPVLFQNLSGYDAHLFIKNLGKTQGNIKHIPNNEENSPQFRLAKKLWWISTLIRKALLSSMKSRINSV